MKLIFECEISKVKWKKIASSIDCCVIALRLECNHTKNDGNKDQSMDRFISFILSNIPITTAYDSIISFNLIVLICRRLESSNWFFSHFSSYIENRFKLVLPISNAEFHVYKSTAHQNKTQTKNRKHF